VDTDDPPDDQADALRDDLEALERDTVDTVDRAVGWLMMRVVPIVLGIFLIAWLARRVRRGVQAR